MIIENFKDDKEALRAMTGELVRYMDRKDDGLPFNLALSGGGTAQKMFALWVDEYKDKIDWDAIRFFWVDERCVPPYACRLYPYSCGRGVCIHDLMIRWGGVRIKKRFNCKK